MFAKKNRLMLTQRIVTVAIVLLLGSLPAWCDSVDFEGSGDGGTWSWNGSGPLTATSLGMSVKVVGSPNTYPVAMPNESFTSGPFLSGTGTSSDPWTFGPSSPLSFTITGCVPPATTCTPVTLFSGQFGSPGEMDVQGSGSMVFSALDVTGMIDPALLSFLGLPTSNTNVVGHL
ncbi:MAG TPA: hypothetical protein VMT20_01365 [Terriglobia bacterium]|nr:hypothetical protein [Terriglobia bacterium]